MQMQSNPGSHQSHCRKGYFCCLFLSSWRYTPHQAERSSAALEYKSLYLVLRRKCFRTNLPSFLLSSHIVAGLATQMYASDGYIARPRHRPNPFADVDEKMAESQ